MLEVLESHVPSGSYDGCLYGDYVRRNETIKRDLAVALLLCMTVSCVLLYHAQLRRLYLPLSRITNASLIMRFTGCIAYFVYFPYAESEGNCTELVINRAYNGVIMLGELHQVYFLAISLGLARMRLFGFTLSQMLNVFTAMIFIVLTASLFYRRLLIFSNLWTFQVSCLQLYVIRQSRMRGNVTDQLISGNETSVRLFEKLSQCQLLPSAFSFIKRTVSVLLHISLFGPLVSVPNVMDEVCVLLFYLKTLLIAENADIAVEMVQ